MAGELSEPLTVHAGAPLGGRPACKLHIAGAGGGRAVLVGRETCSGLGQLNLDSACISVVLNDPRAEEYVLVVGGWVVCRG